MTETYLSFILSLKDVSTTTILAVFLLLFGRLIPIMAITPFLGAKTVPHSIRIGFAACIAFIFLPMALSNFPGKLDFDYIFFGLFLKEVFIGFILGFIASIPFFIAQSSGSLIDHIRGSSSLQVTDPTTHSTTGPIGVLYNYVLIAVFFGIGGPLIFFNALATSYIVIPMQSLMNPNFFSLNVPFWKLIMGIITQIFALGIQLGAPAIIGTLLTEMFLGIANRLAPQIQIVFLGISLKSWVGLAMLALAWYYIANQLSKESLLWLKMMENTIQQASHFKI
jgi:type III secretion protein SpaR/YscT/HrcT